MRRRLLALCVATALALPAAAQETYWVEADDGVLLATDICLPEGDGPWPVVLTRTPYDRTSTNPICEWFNSHGYACVAQDIRGFGASEGDWTLYLEDAADGRATVSWITEQWWCNGSIGTFGLSAPGVTQYRLAPGADPALRCLAPEMAMSDGYHIATYQGGVLREDLIADWLRWVGLPDVLDMALQHRLYDDWWELFEYSVDEVSAAGLHIGGWYDVFLQGTLDAFSEYQDEGGDGAEGTQHLIIGPWTHNSFSRSPGQLYYPAEATVDSPLEEFILPWFDHCLKGESSGAEQWPSALIYLMGPAQSFYLGIPAEPNAPGNEWLALAQWPPPSLPMMLYLGGDESLSRAEGASGHAELLIDPSDPVPTEGGTNLFRAAGPRDQATIEAREDVLVFSTDELTHPLTVMGRVFVHLWIIPDTTDLDLAVRLSDVYPSGHSMLVTDGIQRARMRCSDEYECFLTPGEPTEIVVDLWSTALVFNRGHQVRISVSGSNWPRFEVNPNHGGDLDGDAAGIVARPQILFGADYPSRLVLPVPITEPRRAGGRIGG